MNNHFVAPQYGLDAFNCPYCKAYSTQSWLNSAAIRKLRQGWKNNVKDIAISVCQLCGEAAVWVEDIKNFNIDPIDLKDATQSAPNLDAGAGAGQIYASTAPLFVKSTKGKIVYPPTFLAPLPSDDMPEAIKADYLEAREIFDASPRGAVALLRLCVQKLMPYLGEKGKNINDDIAELVKKGLRPQVQQALDSLRVIGNEAVHPGTLDLNDDKETALALFRLLNVIVDAMITQPKAIAEIYDKLPPDKHDAIQKRDNR